MTDSERAVLAAYKTLCDADPEAAFAPYFDDVAASVGDANLAYACCKSLRKSGLLQCCGQARGGLLNAPSYWISEKGEKALDA